jgi:hypothetical protein
MRCHHQKSSSSCGKLHSLVLISVSLLIINELLVNFQAPIAEKSAENNSKSSFLLVNGHVVLTRDDHGQHLVLTGEDGKKGKGGGGGDQLVIAGSQMGGQNDGGSNMVLQDAANREGDIVMSGKSMIIPGEDGHIVLADSRNQSQRRHHTPINPLIFWAPFMNNRYMSRMLPMMMMMTTPYSG